MQRELGMVTAGLIMGVSVGWVARRIDERTRKMEDEMRSSTSDTFRLDGMDELIEVLRHGLLGEHPNYNYEDRGGARKTRVGLKAGVCPSCHENRPQDAGYILDHGLCFLCDERRSEAASSADISYGPWVGR